MKPISEIAEVIKRRNDLGVSQTELARLSGTSIVNLNDLERGRNQNPTFTTIKKLHKALDRVEKKKAKTKASDSLAEGR